MKFVGIDLTSAFAATPRPIDIAVLDDRLNVTFFTVEWPNAEVVINRNSNFLIQRLLAEIPVESSERMVLAIDGPQGLATAGNTMRTCERILGTQGRTPCTLPPAEEGGVPFQGYIRSSIDFFAGLVRTASPWILAGLRSTSNVEAGLWEVFPGAEWVVLARRQLPLKSTVACRLARRQLFEALQVTFPMQALPTADQNDALVGAYLTWCVHHRPLSVELIGDTPVWDGGQIREGFILHAGPNLGINFPLTEALVTKGTDCEPEGVNDWNHDDASLLMLTDYGLVHGTEPENAWLRHGQDYNVETVPPHLPVTIRLIHAANFPGGRGWRAMPTIRNVLTQLGHPTPQHLARQNAVTLRVVKV